LRIVGGKYKGRTLVAFDGEKIRPTADKVRESLFNILQFKIAGANFLDLFSGTGAMGIEALSRGARKVTFNDCSKQSIAVLRKNLEKLKVEEEYVVKNTLAQTFLTGNTEKFDVIFIDPPYNSGLILEVLPLAKSALSDDGIIVVEDERPTCIEVDGLLRSDERKYGRVYLTFFKREE